MACKINSIKTDELGIKVPLINMQDPKYQQKSKSISPLGQNYFAGFAIRNPVHSLCTGREDFFS